MERLAYLSFPQIIALYNVTRVQCKRCVPNLYVKGNYERCPIYAIRSDVEPHMKDDALAKEIQNCPFS